DGEGKRRRLAGAGLRGPDQIFTGKHNRKRTELNRRRLDKTHSLRAAHDFRRKSKFIKRHSGLNVGSLTRVTTGFGSWDFPGNDCSRGCVACIVHSLAAGTAATTRRQV